MSARETHAPTYGRKPGGFSLYFLFALTALGLHCCTRRATLVGARGLLIAVASLAKHGSRARRPEEPQHVGSVVQLTGSRAQAQELWCTGLVARQHVEPSRTRDQTHVPCTGRQTLNHWITSLSFPLLKLCI